MLLYNINFYGALILKLLILIRKSGLLATCFLLFSVSAMISVLVHAEEKSERTHSLSYLKIMTSNIPLALIARDIVGQLGRVDSLLKAGQSPHDFALKVSDRKRLGQADVLVWLGGDIEPYLLSIAKQQSRHQLSMDELINQRTITSGEANHSEHSHHSEDNHFHAWLSPENSLMLATALVERLIQLKPELKNQLSTNLAAFVADVAEADQVIKKLLAAKNSAQPYAAVHGAYGAFTEHYDLAEPFMISRSTERPPGIKRLLNMRKELPKGSCVLVEPEHAQGWPKQLTAREGLQLVEIDTLAGRQDYPAYTAWLQQFASDFSLCLQLSFKVPSTI